MKHLFFILLLALHAGLLWAQDRSVGRPVVASAERRLALVIGMSEYQHVNRLKNPPNDADDMKATLENLGFTVTLIKNKTKAQTDVAVNAFINSLRPNDVVLFYFSGHGIGYQDDNYLLPTDARVECLEQIAAYTLSAKRLMADFQTKRVRNSFVFLDACRSLDNLEVCQADQKNATKPQGFVIPTGQPSGSILVYATQAGRTADDNVQARNGLFTQELLKHITTPDLTLGDILGNTAEAVLAESLKKGRAQEPTVYGLLGMKFKFLTYANRPDPSDKKLTKFLDLPFADMVYVEGGSFIRGPGEELTFSIKVSYTDLERKKIKEEYEKEKAHSITVNSFMMGKYEVTQRQWTEIMGNNPSYFKNCDDCPVEMINWYEIQEFITKLNVRTGRHYRLPTEAEWEYAAGGGSSNRTTWAGTDSIANLTQYSNFCSKNCGMLRLDSSNHNDCYDVTAPVGQFIQNRLGLHDMSGNVSEWCNDWYSDYTWQNENNPMGPKSGSYKVVRGGSWVEAPDRDTHIKTRQAREPEFKNTYIGFRLVSPIE